MPAPDLDDTSLGGELSVLTALIKRGPLARSELAALRGESLPQMTRLCRPLIEAGLVVETLGPPDGPGRPRRPLAVRGEALHVAGVAVKRGRAAGVVMDLLGDVVSDSAVAMPGDEVQAVVAAVGEVVDRLTTAGHGLAGLGVTVEGGLLRESPGAPGLAELIGSVTGLPTVIETEVGAAIDAEQWFGARSERDNFVLLALGEEIGFGAVVNGQRLRVSGADLISHHPLDPHGPICAAGHQGCADMLTVRSLCRVAGRALRRPLDFDRLLARADHPAINPVLTRAATMLGRLMTAAATFLQADHVILTGTTAELVKVAPAAVDAGLALDLGPSVSPVDYEYQPATDLMWARGAAAAALAGRLAR